MKRPQIQYCFALLLLCLTSISAHASHRVMLFNEKAMDIVLDMWPDFVETLNAQARGIEDMGDRSIIIQTGLRSHINNLLREQPTPAQFAEGFKVLVKDYYLPGGITTFGSRLDSADQVTGFNYLLREEGRLPVRFAWSTEIATQPLPAVATAGIYETMGVMWQTIESNPWLWLRGVSSEGGWDAPNRACLGDDLPVKDGVDRREVKEKLEICPDFTSATVQALMRALNSGWRFVGVHGNGSHGLRIFVNKLEEAMARTPDVLTLDYVRASRHGFAHGTMVGAVPDVVADLNKYNVYVPINLRRALAIEPDSIRKYYGEPGWKFLGPIKTLLEQGVKVVGEGEIGHPHPQSYFEQLHVYVTREISGEFRGQSVKKGVHIPEEGIDRITALKLITYRSAEFLLAEEKIGSLEAGKFADFIVVDQPYLSGSDAAIKNNKVVMTVLAGKREYRDPEFAFSVRQGDVARAVD